MGITKNVLFVFGIFLSLGTQSYATIESLKKTPSYTGKSEPIPAHIATYMTGKSYKPGCPVAMSDLRYLTISYLGFDEQVHEGHMVVHHTIAQDVLDIFGELFAAQYPIERMELIDAYDADDERSMTDNNSSAFCFRENTNTPGIYSNHAYGLAIDINPLQNPFYKPKKDLVAPEAGRPYLDRSKPCKGMITGPGDACYEAFMKRGFDWGGNWNPFDAKGRVDYQHFAKEAPSLCH